ncbi:hypothetical protein BCV70DRAFT_35855 [Testicularia cyperi]|uniref:Histone H1 n=1 Tax=Testicularia cyperi TaxID=1882483 RepID=A0A317XIT7_9BASI|nr:hypothetical protein BCV70DRAFT_35855 [Testicularia cyperi]
MHYSKQGDDIQSSPSQARHLVLNTLSTTNATHSVMAMIKEAVLAHPAEARAGIGRATIKKYIQSHHPETAKGSEASFNTRVNQAITKGAAKKVFVLPKGPSGKVKLAPKVKEEKKPAAKKVAAKKPAAKKVAAKKPAAKKTAAKKPAAKKTVSSTTTKAAKPAAKKAAPAKKA